MNSFNRNFCPHTRFVARVIPLSDGRPALREFCVSCGMSSGGSNLGFALPMIADKDIVLSSRKYPGKTMEEILKIDTAYIRWIITDSKASGRIKKAAIRLYCGKGYIPPKDGEIYPKEKIYDPTEASKLLLKIK